MTQPTPTPPPAQPAAQPAPAPAPARPASATTQPEETTNLLSITAGAGIPDGTGLSADEEAELTRLQAKSLEARRGEGGTVEMKITSGHASVSYGGHTVTSDWTPTPAWLVPAFVSAAAESGVELEQREQEES